MLNMICVLWFFLISKQEREFINEKGYTQSKRHSQNGGTMLLPPSIRPG